MPNDFDQLAMQGEDTGIVDPEQHVILVLSDEGKQTRWPEFIAYTAECSCGWRSERLQYSEDAWGAAGEHLAGVK